MATCASCRSHLPDGARFCPSCGRDNVGVHLLAEEVEQRLLDYPQVCAILIVILIAVSIVDGLSGVLRRRFQ